MNYTEDMKIINDCLEEWEDKRFDGILAAHAILEYAQWIEKINFEEAKELFYRFAERVLHPEWD